MLLLVACANAFAQTQKSFFKKLSPELQRLVSSNQKDSITISVSVKKGFVPNAGGRVLFSLPQGFLVLRLPTNRLAEWITSENIVFVSKTTLPREEITTGVSDPTLNLISYTQNRYPALRGDSICVSIKERFFDTADIDLKSRIFKTGLEDPAITSHASLMATVMAGGGNSSPFAKGAAPGAMVTSSSFANLFPDHDSIFRKHVISVQNHSYGTLVENFYGNEAAAYDASAVNNPALLHVFSAGNSGNLTPTDGAYAGVAYAANLSGNFKQAKNIVTVSAVDSTGRFLLLSSKGPAYDGRVKPELVAYGEDGSSGAAALTSGAALLVQNAYKRLRQNTLPSAALVKAVLLNSADEAGEKAIDYASGFGNLNAYKAVETVMQNRFAEDSLAAASAKSILLTVPANASQLKVTLTWTDPAALPNASKALVNDLDLVVKKGNETFLPWVLNSHRDSLLQPAQRKKDTLNNTEQVSIGSPPAGTYEIEVSANQLRTTTQAFALAYTVDTTNDFYWTFPTSTDPLLAGQTHTLRWQTNLSGRAKIEYSFDDEHWRVLTDTADAAKHFYKWIFPDTVSLARLRLQIGPAAFLSDRFVISPPTQMQTGFVCVDSFLLYWNKVGAVPSRLYELGEKYMQPFIITSDTALILYNAQHPSTFYSVAPIAGGQEGLRSNVLNYANSGTACYLRGFFVEAQTLTSVDFSAQLGTVYNVAQVSLEKLEGSDYRTLQTIHQPQTAAFNFTDNNLHPGQNQYRLKITLANGAVVYSSIETVFTVSETRPVVFYPNPIAQSGTLNVVVREVGRYTLFYFDATGKKVYQQSLNTTLTPVRAGRFAKGIYFIRVVDREGKTWVQKQLIN